MEINLIDKLIKSKGIVKMESIPSSQSSSHQSCPNTCDKKIPQRKFELTAVFNETIYNLWPIFKEKAKIESIVSQTNINLILPKNNTSPYTFSVVDVSSLECSKTIEYEVFSPDSKMVLKLNFNCVSNTLDNSSFVTIIIILKNVDDSSSKISSCHFKKFAFDIIKGIQNILEEEPLYDYETIELNCSMKVAWDYLISFEIFKEDKNKYELKREGDKIIWKHLVDPNEKKFETQYIEIVSKKCEEGRKKWSFTVIPSGIKMAIKQDIKFILIKLEEKLTLLTIRHELKEKISLSHFEFMRNEKQGLISVMKKSLELLQKEEDNKKKNETEKKEAEPKESLKKEAEPKEDTKAPKTEGKKKHPNEKKEEEKESIEDQNDNRSNSPSSEVESQFSRQTV
ncbi:MAG: hypothetical protein MJ252_04315 [archaeon]|nr:hypothetical protein [archaeon]